MTCVICKQEARANSNYCEECWEKEFPSRAKPIGPSMQWISEGSVMSESDKAILILGIRYAIVTIAGIYGITQLKDDATATAIASAIAVVIYVGLGIVEKLKTKNKIEQVEHKAEIAATTDKGLPPDV